MKLLPPLPARADTVAARQQSVVRAIHYMRENMDEQVSLEVVCRVAGISKFHFIRVFESITGTSPHQFWAALRIQKAKLMLSRRVSVTEACFAVGYSSLGTFSRIFRELVGIGPKEFQAMVATMGPAELQDAVTDFLSAATVPPAGAGLNGATIGLKRPPGFVFVGVFPEGIPKGVPDSGTVTCGFGPFQLPRPARRYFHVLAVVIPFAAPPADIVTGELEIPMIAGCRCDEESRGERDLILQLRPREITDPPIVISIPAMLRSVNRSHHGAAASQMAAAPVTPLQTAA